MNPEREVAVSGPAGSPAWRAVLSLALVAAVAGLLIGLAWDRTRQRIAHNESLRTLELIRSVLPGDLYDNQPQEDRVLLDLGDGGPAPVYRARLHGQPSAAVFTVTTPDGYAGPIQVLVGLALDGQVLGVRVLSHSETPGIGDAIDGSRSPWIGIFRGRSLGDPPAQEWRVTQDGGQFDAIAGATISSRAVVGAVGRAVAYYADHRQQVFAPEAPSP